MLVDHLHADGEERVVEERGLREAVEAVGAVELQLDMRRDAEARLEVRHERALAVLPGDDARLQLDLGSARGLQTQVGRLESPSRPLRCGG